MTTLLGIDPAWTPRNPSGVALVRSEGTAWQCMAVAPSYESFLGLAVGRPVDWDRAAAGGAANIPALLAAANAISGEPVSVVAVDMPLSRAPIVGRRAADSAVSRAFGAQHCSTHSPSIDQPGQLSVVLREQLELLGYPLKTLTDAAGSAPALIEVYPHPALLTLMNRAMRVPYKVDRRSRYWKAESPAARIRLVHGVIREIAFALSREFSGLGALLPAERSAARPALLKRMEDALDALVCAWVASKYSGGDASRFGDQDAAIWLPRTKTAMMD